MQTPSAPAMLGAWERGVEQDAVERGLELLALACPDRTADALAALSIGERDRMLLALRETLFGSRMTGVVSCPRCGESLEFDFDAAGLRAAPPGGSLELCQDGVTLQLRLPDSRDLRACTAVDASAAPALLLQRCVVTALRHGQTMHPGELSPQLADQAARRLAEADPQTDMRFALDCAACGYSWRAPFDVVRFLWAELETWAVRLLQDVHTLASAYGWAERDILALGGTRRRYYLRMLDA